MDRSVNLFRYRWLLQELIVRDLKIKYRRSVLGYLWSVLNPLMMMGVLTIVFSTMFRFDIPNYPVYLLAGQLIYGFYSESTSMAMGAILNSASLIKKVYLPKYIFPLSRVLSCFTTMLFSLVALFVVMVITGGKFYLTIILLPVALVYVLVFSIGMGLILSAMVVFFRDIEHLYGVLLTAFNYLTPVFYPVSILPPWLRQWMFFNPFYNFIQYFRNIVLYGQWPTLQENALCAGFAFGALAMGIWFFRRHQDDFVLHV